MQIMKKQENAARYRAGVAALLLTALFLASGTSAHAQTAQNLFEQHCASCHQGHFGLSGAAYEWQRDHAVAKVASLIREGLPQDGMPSFAGTLSDTQILALATLVQPEVAAPIADRQISVLSLNPEISANYQITVSEDTPDLRYLGHIDGGSQVCFDNLDMTGVNSVELHYARGTDETGRFAMIVIDSSGLGQRLNLGEKALPSSGGWETFKSARVGFSQTVQGRRTFCFMGLEGGGIFNLAHFTLSAKSGENDGVTWRPDRVAEHFSAGGHHFALERVGEAPVELWAMTFLPDGTIAATQKNGGLLLFRNGERLGPVTGTPPVWNRSQGGMLAVLPHPDYAKNGWLYLSYSDMGENNTTMTRIVRGQLDGLKWVNQQTIYQAPAEFYSEYYAHFGSRMVIQKGYIYFSVGDRGQGEQAQSKASPFGKIHRLHDDGRVPKDNPFVAVEGAQASVWSYGHRNPQGMAIHPKTGDIWSAEHGPAGGDEVNLIRKGLNYGWPLVSHGVQYDGTVISESPYLEGTEPPLHHWTPSIAVSQIHFYTGNKFPAWRNHLLVGTLGQQEMRLLRLNGKRVVGEELLLKNLGRIRDVVNGPDGYPYLVLNQPNGSIYRLVPISDSKKAKSSP